MLEILKPIRMKFDNLIKPKQRFIDCIHTSCRNYYATMLGGDVKISSSINEDKILMLVDVEASSLDIMCDDADEISSVIDTYFQIEIAKSKIYGDRDIDVNRLAEKFSVGQVLYGHKLLNPDLLLKSIFEQAEAFVDSEIDRCHRSNPESMCAWSPKICLAIALQDLLKRTKVTIFPMGSPTRPPTTILIEFDPSYMSYVDTTMYPYPNG